MTTPEVAIKHQQTRPLAALALGLAAFALLAIAPDHADAALRSAAGGGAQGSGGFARLGDFLDKITTYLIWLAAPCAGLGVVAGGVMLIAGNPRASRLLGLVALGFAVIVTAKGLVA
jgi:hypothetical protein